MLSRQKWLVVFKRELLRTVKGWEFLFFLVMLVISLIPASIGVTAGMKRLFERDLPWEQLRPSLEWGLGFTAYLLGSLTIFLFPVIYGFGSLVQREKARRIPESLLATPVKAWELWLGKSLAAFLPGFVAGEILGGESLLFINTLFIVPATGRFFLPLPLALGVLLAVPLLGLSFVLVIMALGLILSRPEAALGISALLFQGLVHLFARFGSFCDWKFVWIHVGLAAMFGLSLPFLCRFLTPERVVLSSRGG